MMIFPFLQSHFVYVYADILVDVQCLECIAPWSTQDSKSWNPFVKLGANFQLKRFKKTQLFILKKVKPYVSGVIINEEEAILKAWSHFCGMSPHIDRVISNEAGTWDPQSS